MSMNGSPPLTLFDPAQMLALLGGNRELARLAIKSAADDMPNYFSQLEQALSSHDQSAIRRVIHTMKSMMGQIGAKRLASRLQEIDLQLKNQPNHDQVFSLAELQAEYALLTEALHAWL